MRKFWILLLILYVTPFSAKALALNAPEIPDSAALFMPQEPENLREGIRYVFHQALQQLHPDLKEAYRVCSGIVLTVMIISLVASFPGSSGKNGVLVGAVSISLLMLSPAETMIHLASNAIEEVSQYGKLLIPVLTGALAAQGGISSSGVLYAGTVAFNGLLAGLITGVLIPAVYCYLAFAVVNCISAMDMTKNIRDGIKSAVTWLLKSVLYVFTAYMGLTGVVSGSTDAAALKAAKLTISSVVPVVGGILSDASEAVLVSAETAKNAVGIYGMFALLAIWIGPFLKIGVHYLLLRLTGMICGIFVQKEISQLIQDFTSALGLLLAMTAAVCVLFLISVFCFMRGVG